MSTLRDQLDRTPVTFLVLLAYVTFAFLTDPLRPSTGALIERGAALGVLIQDGEPWRLFTYSLLHGGLLHLLFNGWFLFLFGPQLEARLGSLRFALLYVVTAISGAIAGGLMTEPIVPLVGGSGSLFGMFGAAIALLMRDGRTHLDFLSYRGPRSLLLLIGFNLVLGWLLPFVSNSAHVGGLVSGFALTFCFFARDRARARPDATSRAIRIAWIALFAGLVLYATRPVLRWDYLYRQGLSAPTELERRGYRTALERGGVSLFEPVVGARWPEIDEAMREALPMLLGDVGERLIERWRP